MLSRRRTHRPPSPYSIWQPIHLGVDETGAPVRIVLAERNLLIAGEPGAGKSVALNLIVAHAALSLDCQLVLVDGKRVELGLWRSCADAFIGPSIVDALDVLRRLQSIMDSRYDILLDVGRRKITAASRVPVIVIVIDELAYFSATVGEAKQQKEFVTLVRDLVARGRAAGVVVVAATQRPSADIVPTSLRDLFGYRWAFRCTTDSSSDVILGHGWANEGYTATDIDPAARGVGWLIAEGGMPRRMKAAYLTDQQATGIAEHAAVLRAEQGRPRPVRRLRHPGRRGMTTRPASSGRYLQLWFVFTWTGPAGRVPVWCPACQWRGRRVSAGSRPCPGCGADKVRGRL